jgi:anti-sigma factor RsiW
MTCHEFTEFLLEYFSNELPAQQRAVFERHLVQCLSCRRYLQSYAQTVRLSKAALAEPEAPTPADVPEELIQAILTARTTRG